jgi:hypothetical protein
MGRGWTIIKAYEIRPPPRLIENELKQLPQLL